MTCSLNGLGVARLAPFQGPPGPRGDTGETGAFGATRAQGEPGPANPDPSAYPIRPGQDLGGQRVVGLGGDGRAVLASCNTFAHFERVLGVTLAAAHAGSRVMMHRVGPISDIAPASISQSSHTRLGTIFQEFGNAISGSVLMLRRSELQPCRPGSMASRAGCL